MKYHSEIDSSCLGFSDMSLFELFVEQRKFKSYLEHYFPDGTFVDVNINIIGKATQLGRIKNIIFNDGVPFMINRVTKRAYRMHSIHFNGGAKKLMPTYASFDKKDFNVLNFTDKDLTYIFERTLKEQRKTSVRFLGMNLSYKRIID